MLIAIILHIANNPAVMGKNTNGKWSNLSGAFTLLVMTAAAVTLLTLQVLEWLHQ